MNDNAQAAYTAMPVVPQNNGTMNVTPRVTPPPAFLRGLMSMASGNRTIASFASANAGEPYDETVIRTAASATSGNGSFMKRNFQDMEAHNVKTRAQEKPVLHNQGIPNDWHKMEIRGYGLGEDLKRRIVDPRFTENYNQIVEAISIGSAQLLNAVNAIKGGTIPANSSLMRGVRFHTYDGMGRVI